MLRKTFYISLSLCFTLVLGNISFAISTDELQDKISASNQNKAQLEKEIDGYQKQLTEIDGQATTLQSTIKSLDISSNKLTAEIKLTKNYISETTLGIQDTGIKIGDKNEQIIVDTKIVVNTLKELAKADAVTLPEIILSNENLSGFWNDVEAIIQLQSKIRERILDIKLLKTDLEVSKVDLEQKKSKLEAYNKDLSNQNLILLSTKKEKNSLLTVTKNTQANYAKILAEKKSLMDSLNQEISQYESQLRLAIDPKSYPPAGKGILAWPLDKITITQKFGYTAFAKTAYASGYHNGLDFAASIGTKLKSAGNGVVESVGDTDAVCPGASFGKWVFIRYDNGLASTYGHLSLIQVKAGQRVNTGDVVGYSGNSGYSTGPHLHMSVYAGQGVKISTLKSSVCRGTYTMPIADPKAYLDPLVYL